MVLKVKASSALWDMMDVGHFRDVMLLDELVLLGTHPACNTVPTSNLCQRLWILIRNHGLLTH